MERVFAAALGLDSAVEELEFRLFPEIYNPFTLDTFSKCLKRDSLKHIGHAIGLSDLRDFQASIVNKHADPDAVPIDKSNKACDLQQGHTSETARVSYTRPPDLPRESTENAVQSYRRASRWWQHITGTWNRVLIEAYVDIGSQGSNHSNHLQRAIKRRPTTVPFARHRRPIRGWLRKSND